MKKKVKDINYAEGINICVTLWTKYGKFNKTGYATAHHIDVCKHCPFCIIDGERVNCFREQLETVCDIDSLISKEEKTND